MRKKKTKVVCMICGNKMDSIFFDNTFANVAGGVTLEIKMPYGSTLDGNVYSAALCDECISKAAKEKKINLKARGVLW